MGREENLKTLELVFEEVFGTKIVLEDNTGPDDIEGWDSLNNIRLLTTIEEKFNIELDTTDILELDRISSVLDLLDQKLS